MAILNVKLPTNLTEYPNSFKRQGSFPLEAYSVFYAIHDEAGEVVTSAFAAAQDYAKNNPISYVGQILAVVDVNADGASEVKVYKIENTDGDLVPVGDTSAGDAASEAVEALQERLDALVTEYTAKFENIENDVEDLQGAVESLETALENIYTKSEVDAKETALSEAIESEAARAAAAEKVLEDALANVYDKDTINTTLGAINKSVSDEVTRATEAEAALNKAITDEASRAAGAEAELADDIADLVLEVATKADASTVYTKEEVHTYVASEIGSAGHLKRDIVLVLPEGEDIDTDTIYMIAKEGAEGQDVYVEYMYINHGWEVIGDTTIDLTPYAKVEDVESAIAGVNAEIDKKADQSALESAVTTLNSSISTKADAAEVEAALAEKANASEVEAALAEKAVKTEVEAALGELGEQIEAVSEGAKSYTDAEIDALETVIATKVDNTTYTTAIENINENITNITNIIGGTENADGSLLDRIGALETNKANAADVYTKGETYTRTEISDLIAQITGGESAADVLAELNAYKGTTDTTIAAMQSASSALTDRVTALENVGAQANVLEAINFNGQDIAIVDKKATFSYTYDLPVAMAEALGGVKSSSAENKISVDAEGNMEVNSLNVNKLTQTEGDTLILNGGSATV